MPGDVLFIPASCVSPALGLSGSPLQGQPDSLQVLPVFYKVSENGLGRGQLPAGWWCGRNGGDWRRDAGQPKATPSLTPHPHLAFAVLLPGTARMKRQCSNAPKLGGGRRQIKAPSQRGWHGKGGAARKQLSDLEPARLLSRSCFFLALCRGTTEHKLLLTPRYFGPKSETKTTPACSFI